jgi:hypothetical protein
MFSRAIGRRCYSTPKAALKLWVKHNGSQPIKVPIKGCIDFDDFAKEVKQELDTKSPVTLFTSLDKGPLRPGLKIAELLNTDDFKNNTDESPLFAKIIPATQDSIARKTIYIRETDDNGEFTDEYVEYSIKNNENFRDINNNGRGLIHLADPKKIIVDFDVIEDGEKYQVYKYSQDFAGWQMETIYEDLSYGETTCLIY